MSGKTRNKKGRNAVHALKINNPNSEEICKSVDNIGAATIMNEYASKPVDIIPESNIESKPELELTKLDELILSLSDNNKRYLIKKLLENANISRVRCPKHVIIKPEIDLNNIYVINVVSQLKRIFFRHSYAFHCTNLVYIYKKQYLKLCNSMCKDCVIEYASNNPLTCIHDAYGDVRCCNICQRLVLNCYSCGIKVYNCDICKIRCCKECLLNSAIVSNNDKICIECTNSILHKYFQSDMEKIIYKNNADAAASI
jgi:hypothetical protein